MIVVLKIKMRKNKRTLINLSLLSAFGLFLTYTFIKNYVFESSIARFRIVQTTQLINNSKKVILFWNKFFESRYWMMPNETNGEEYLKSIQCPVTNCIFTHDKNFLDQSHLYDAIVFHSAEVWWNLDLPATRSPHQLYVSTILE